MTDQHAPGPVDPFDPDQPLGQFTGGFGRDLVAATAARERRVPRRRIVVAMATASAAAVAIVAVLAVALPGGGGGGGPLGVTPAEAAVGSLRDALQSGVLFREWESTIHTHGGVDRTPITDHDHMVDWTDLATRREHYRSAGGSAPGGEFWNPSEHERYSVDPRLRAADGRAVVTYANDPGSSNGSSSGSPIEEVLRLQDSAKQGKLSLRHVEVDGAPAVALELRQHCYSTADGGVQECPENGKGWPNGGPKMMHPVISFQTWWLSDGGAPRMLREDNGTLDPATGKRSVFYSARYLRWDVLPATKANLTLVLPPPASSKDYLVLKGKGAVAQALSSGQIVRARASRSR